MKKWKEVENGRIIKIHGKGHFMEHFGVNSEFDMEHLGRMIGILYLMGTSCIYDWQNRWERHRFFGCETSWGTCLSLSRNGGTLEPGT